MAATLHVPLAAAALLCAGLAGFGTAAEARQSDSQIKQKIINASIENYSGSCPCPYNVTRNGSSCGGRSAYSRPGGESPKCYPSDITTAEVKAYRGR